VENIDRGIYGLRSFVGLGLHCAVVSLDVVVVRATECAPERLSVLLNGDGTDIAEEVLLFGVEAAAAAAAVGIVLVEADALLVVAFLTAAEPVAVFELAKNLATSGCGVRDEVDGFGASDNVGQLWS
jgi:hypothetical protein